MPAVQTSTALSLSNSICAVALLGGLGDIEFGKIMEVLAKLLKQQTSPATPMPPITFFTQLSMPTIMQGTIEYNWNT